MVYSPAPVVIEVATVPVAVSVMITLAPTTTAPLESRAVPSIVPRSDCANAPLPQTRPASAPNTRALNNLVLDIATSTMPNAKKVRQSIIAFKRECQGAQNAVSTQSENFRFSAK